MTYCFWKGYYFRTVGYLDRQDAFTPPLSILGIRPPWGLQARLSKHSL